VFGAINKAKAWLKLRGDKNKPVEESDKEFADESKCI
jgi:hypothetical protein